MTRVILDDLLRNKLHDLRQPLELCDAAGRVVARLFPEPDLSQFEPLVPAISPEELKRRKESEEKRYTTAEVRAHLEGL